jgi:formylmethanofuran dehydrogenase subunit E
MQNTELLSLIDKAKKLHGHLGPFLVIGVRMGAAAKKAFGISDKECTLLSAEAKVPLFPPFSCLLDGIQTATTCTVGNQRLAIEDAEGICVRFSKQGEGKTVKITLKPEITETLRKKHDENALTEKLASEIALIPETQLLNIEIE